MIPMAGLFPELAVQNYRCFDFLIAIPAMHFPPVLNQLIANNHAVWMEERESRPFLVQTEQIQFFAQLAVIAFLRLFQHVQIGI